MKTYLVDLTIICGEYEKTNKMLVQAKNKELAKCYGIYCEAHEPDDLEWQGNMVLDLGGEFGYKASADLVPESDIETLEKYLPLFVCDTEDLMLSGDFPELGIL